MYDMKNLLEIMAALRDPDSGCPWDLQQTFKSIAPYTVEEAYEVADAIERDAIDELPDELGDLLLQVVFHARMAEEAGRFDFADVVTRICTKMKRRHPHVFGTAHVGNAEAQTESWEAIKSEERRGQKGGVLGGVAIGQPAMSRAVKLGQRASRVGFDWPELGGVLAKVHEELAELEEARTAGDRDAMAAEFGDVMFAIANLGRHLNLDPESCLRGANRRFESRFAHIEAAVEAAARDWPEFALEELDALWLQAKLSERGAR
jgi:MazG family protein